jgi:4-amino-4-deoxy-L-arabinose transferase-like glycosyltransferase
MEEPRTTPARVTAYALLGALTAAFAAQYLFTGEVFTRLKDSVAWAWTARYGAGTFLLLLAFGLAAWYGRPDPREPEPPARPPRAGGRDVRVAVALSLALNAAAVGLFLLRGESAAVRTLWLLAMVSLALPLLLPALRAPRVLPGDAGRWAPWEGPALLALTSAGFFLRFHRITELPEHVDNDVALMGVETLRVMQRHDPRWFAQAASDHLLSNHQMQALAFRLFGSDHFGLVMLSVVAGTLTIPVLYSLARDAFSRRVAVISTVLLVTSYTHIHFSRIQFGPSATFLLCLSLAHLFRAFRTGRASNWAAGGLAMGLSLLTYDSSRVGPVIVLSVVAACVVWKRTEFRAQLAGWGLFLVGAFVGFGPATGFVIHSLRSFIGRGHTVMIWSPGVLRHSMEKYHVDSVAAVLLEQVRRTFLTLHLYGDESPHFALPRPMVGALAAALCVLGAGIAVARIRRTPHLLVLAWVALTFFLGGVLTADPPYWPHLNIALPAIVLLGGLGADRLIQSLSAAAPSGRVLVPAVLGLALLATGVHEWGVYARYAGDNAGRRVEAARFLDELPGETQVYLIADDVSWNDYSFRFFTRDMAGRDVRADDLLSGREKLPVERPYTLVLFRHEAEVPLLARLSPLSKVEAHRDHDGALLFTSISVIPPGFNPRVQPLPTRPGLLPLAVAGLLAAGWVVVQSFRSALATREELNSRCAGS